jgi:hypothetical protein
VHNRGRHQGESAPPPYPPPPPAPHSPSPPPSSPTPRRRSKRRRLAIAIAATIAIGAGAATIDIAISGDPADASSGITVQANISLNQAVAELEKLGFAGTKFVQSAGSNPSADCAQNASGDVRQFLSLHPCKEYAISSLTMNNSQGISTQAAVSWVVMPSAALADQYKMMVDKHHSGNPPGEPTAIFNGLCYASGQSGETVWVSQVRKTSNLAADRQILQAVAPQELTASYLKVHCID